MSYFLARAILLLCCVGQHKKFFGTILFFEIFRSLCVRALALGRLIIRAIIVWDSFYSRSSIGIALRLRCWALYVMLLVLFCEQSILCDPILRKSFSTLSLSISEMKIWVWLCGEAINLALFFVQFDLIMLLLVSQRSFMVEPVLYTVTVCVSSYNEWVWSDSL